MFPLFNGFPLEKVVPARPVRTVFYVGGLVPEDLLLCGLFTEDPPLFIPTKILARALLGNTRETYDLSTTDLSFHPINGRPHIVGRQTPIEQNRLAVLLVEVHNILIFMNFMGKARFQSF